MGVDGYDLVELSELRTVEAITTYQREEPSGKEFNNFLISGLSASFWESRPILTFSL